MPGDELSWSVQRKRPVRHTVSLLALILVFTAVLVGIKYWVVSGYLLGH